jgi:septum formation protein
MLLPELPVILASGSPRRQELLRELGITFRVLLKQVDEFYPEHLKREEVAEYLAKKKAAAYDEEVTQGNVIITADTIVCAGDVILNKPEDFDDGVRMLKLLSGTKHEVVTAVCIRSLYGTEVFHDTTDVYFKPLTDEEIRYYLDTCKPYDKAGSYGVQEWIGLIGIERIDGSYHNVVGLPVRKVYEHLISLAGKWSR